MSRRNWPPVSVDFSPIPAAPLCHVVTGDQGRGSCDETCDCQHTATVKRRRKIKGIGVRRVPIEVDWNVSIDPFSGTAITYAPVYDEELGHELITEPELAELLR